MSTFGSLNTARSGLAAAQRGLDVLGQNIANATTRGYTRREVSNVAAEPDKVILGPGRGVRDTKVVRYRDEFLDRQFRNRSGARGYQETRSEGLSHMEEMLGDLSNGGLRLSLDQVFNSWDRLALRPLDPGAQRQVVGASEQFLGDAKASYERLYEYRATVDASIADRVTQINSASQQLADLNKSIALGKANGQEIDDLVDRRDLLIDSLAQIAGTTAVTHNDDMVTVHLGSLPLVDRQVAYQLDTSAAVEATPPGQWVTSITWNGSATPALFGNGEVAGLLELRDKQIPAYMSYLDNLTRSVATQVNQLHNPVGATDDIFVVNTAWMAIEVNPVIQADPSKVIAAGSLPPTASDGRLAQQIAQLRSQTILAGNPVGTSVVTPGQYLQAVSGQLGSDVQQALRLSQSATLQVDQADKQRQTVSGVSIDEEMTKMVQFQQAYNASARVITAIDQMLDTVVNRMGLAGR